MNSIVLKKFKATPKSHDKCVICNKRSVKFIKQVCKDCVLFYETITKKIVEVSPVSCTKDVRCFQYLRNNYCPWHKYIKCEMYLSRKKKPKKSSQDSLSSGASMEKVIDKNEDISETSSHNESNSSRDLGSTPDSTIVSQEPQEVVTTDPTLSITNEHGNLKKKCCVCENKRLPDIKNSQLCKKCYKFYLIVQRNELPLRCRQDSSCVKFTATKYCHDHKYQKCLKFINNDSCSSSNKSIQEEISSSCPGNKIKEKDRPAENADKLQTEVLNNSNTNKIPPSRRKSKGMMCDVCHKRRLGKEDKVCAQCYKYYHMLDSQQIAVNCTRDARCKGEMPKDFCPLHRFLACQQLICNDEQTKGIPCRALRVILNKLNLDEVVTNDKKIKFLSEMEVQRKVNRRSKLLKKATVVKINNEIDSSTNHITQPVANSSKTLSDTVTETSKNESESVVHTSKETTEFVLNTSKKATEYVVNTSKDATGYFDNTNNETTEYIVNNTKNATEYVVKTNNVPNEQSDVHTSKETTQSVLSTSKKATEYVVNTTKETTTSVNTINDGTSCILNTKNDETQSLVDSKNKSAHYVVSKNSLDQEIDDLEKELSLLSKAEEKENSDLNSIDVQNDGKVLELMSRNGMIPENSPTRTKTLSVPDHANTHKNHQNNTNQSEELQKAEMGLENLPTSITPLISKTELGNKSTNEEIKQPGQNEKSFFCISVNTDSEIPQKGNENLDGVPRDKDSSKVLSQITLHIPKNERENRDNVQIKHFGKHNGKKSRHRSDKLIEKCDENSIGNNSKISILDCHNPDIGKHLPISNETSLSCSEKTSSHGSKPDMNIKICHSKKAPKENESHGSDKNNHSSNNKTNSEDTLQTIYRHGKLKKRPMEGNTNTSECERKSQKYNLEASENFEHETDKSNKRISTNKAEINTSVKKLKEHNQSESEKCRKKSDNVNTNLVVKSHKRKSTIDTEINSSNKEKSRHLIQGEKSIAIKEYHSKLNKRKKDKHDSSLRYSRDNLPPKKMKLKENLNEIEINRNKSSSESDSVKQVVNNVNVLIVESHETKNEKEKTIMHLDKKQRNKKKSMESNISLELRAQQTVFESPCNSDSECPNITPDEQTIAMVVGLEESTKLMHSEIEKSITDSNVVNNTSQIASTTFVTTNKSEQPIKSDVILDFVVHDELDFDEELPVSQSSNVDVDISENATAKVSGPVNDSIELSESQTMLKNLDNVNETMKFKADDSKNSDVEYKQHKKSTNTHQKNTKKKIDASKTTSPQTNVPKTILLPNKDVQKTTPQVNVVPKTISPQKVLSKTISPQTKDVPKTTSRKTKIVSKISSPRAEDVSSLSNDEKKTKEPDFHSDDLPNLKKELMKYLVEERSFILKFLTKVSLERRLNFLDDELRHNFNRPLLMAIACYALYWNGEYRLSQLFRLLRSLLITRYETFLEVVMRLVIILAHDEVFSDIIHQYAVNCGKTHLIAPEKRKNFVRNLILPAVISESCLFFKCFKLMVADNLEIPDSLILQTGRELAALRQSDHLDYFVDTLLEIHSGRIPELMDKFKNNSNPVLPYFLHTLPDDVACRYQKAVKPDINSTLNTKNHRGLHMNGEKSLDHDHSHFDSSHQSYTSYSNANQPEELFTSSKSVIDTVSSLTNESSRVSVLENSSPLTPHLKNGIFGFPHVNADSRYDISVNMRGKLSNDKYFDRNDSPLNMNGFSSTVLCDAESELGVFDDPTVDQVVSPTFDSFGIGNSDPLGISSYISPDNSASQILEKSSSVFGAFNSVNSTPQLVGHSTSNPFKQSKPQNPFGQSSKLNSENSTATVFRASSNSQASQKSSLPVFGLSNTAVFEKTNSETSSSSSKLFGTFVTKNIFGQPLSSSSNPQIFGQSTPLSSCISLQPEKSSSGSVSLPESTNKAFTLSENLTLPVMSTSGVFGVRNQPAEDNDIVEVLDVVPRSRMIETINLLSDESNSSADADISQDNAQVDRAASFTELANSSDLGVIRPFGKILWPSSITNSSTLDTTRNITDAVHTSPDLALTRCNDLNCSDTSEDLKMKDTPSTSAAGMLLCSDVDKEVAESSESILKHGSGQNKRRKSERVSFRAQQELVEVREIESRHELLIDSDETIRSQWKDLRELLRAKQSEGAPALYISLPAKTISELIKDANEFISRLRLNYNSMTDLEKLQFIDEFYSSQLPQSHFEYILHQCDRSKPLMWNLSSVVLNKLTDSENLLKCSDVVKHALLLINRCLDDFIQTPVILQSWSPLRTWLFLNRFFDKADVFPMLERYNLLEEDRREWQLAWKEEDMEAYCVSLALLLHSFDGTTFKCIRLCRALMFWYKETPQYFSSPGLDFPRTLEIVVLGLLNQYFYITVEDNDLKDEYKELRVDLLPLIKSLLASGVKLSVPLTRGCICYLVHMSHNDLALTTIHSMPLSPPFYSLYETGDVIYLKDIYTREEMSLLFPYALQNLSSELLNQLKANKTHIKIRFEKSSLTPAGYLAQEELKRHLPDLFSLLCRRPSPRDRLLACLDDPFCNIEPCEEQPPLHEDTVLLEPMLTVAFVHSLWNKKMLQESEPELKV